MMRSANGDLHYYFNGVNQGVACTDLPSGKDPTTDKKNGQNLCDVTQIIS